MSVDRLLKKDTEGGGRRISARARQTSRTVEAYLRSGDPPRWMTRLSEIERGIARERRRLAAARAALSPGEDWRALVRAWRFDEALNDLIRTHNEWYPVERDLPMDLRTRDYVLVNGRSYRRPVLGPDWALAEFPPEDAAPGSGHE
jgi:hypothetical protein